MTNNIINLSSFLLTLQDNMLLHKYVDYDL